VSGGNWTNISLKEKKVFEAFSHFGCECKETSKKESVRRTQRRESVKIHESEKNTCKAQQHIHMGTLVRETRASVPSPHLNIGLK